jgi:hypothetical protein
MTEASPTEEEAREVGRVVGRIPHLGYYLDQRNVFVVLLPRDASADGLPSSAAGWQIEYLYSDLTLPEYDTARSQVTAIAKASNASCGVHYDARSDRISVSGYFPDPSTPARLSRIKGVAVTMAVEGFAGELAEQRLKRVTQAAPR